ncbi:L,D-transpeptidase family protein [Burkholderiaceae bacterium DAT-1]|nr:L,D-transpeptidase family protein [Burkholderiaceae bacterium DAT-1]
MKIRSWLKPAISLSLIALLAPASSSGDSAAVHGVTASRDNVQQLISAAGNHPEQLMVAALTAIRGGQLENATRIIDTLIASKPNYRLAHLVKGDLLMAQVRPITAMGNADGPTDKLNDLRLEAMRRLERYQAPPPVNEIPANLLYLAEKQTYAVVVDASRSRIFVYRNDGGTPKYITDFYVTIGKLGFGKSREGDQRSPVGVYFVTGKLPREQLDKTYGAQADLYGVGAWPLSYPNDWDRREGRTGHGIWLHGSPADTYSRAPQASNGCVVLTNPDMGTLATYLTTGTPVVISPKVEWISKEDWMMRRDAARAELESWRKDWESLDTTRYLSHYAEQFTSGSLNLAQWRTQKAQVNASKRWVKVQLEEVSLFAYPTPTGAMLMANFVQNYQSDNLSNRMQKRLYWNRSGSNWKIILEGAPT